MAAQARRRLRGKNKAKAGGRRHEYLEETAGMGATATADVPAYAATGRGTGPLGFAGTAPAAASTRVAATVRLSSDEARQVIPMLPSTWEADGGDEN
ncbi:Hypothetical PPE-family protein [Mycobacteroides abscessus subsp. abscessus]|nr:Hypothetical PPE-family protein [Mycobacteroides abscessus subsp. abscessus]